MKTPILNCEIGDIIQHTGVRVPMLAIIIGEEYSRGQARWRVLPIGHDIPSYLTKKIATVWKKVC